MRRMRGASGDSRVLRAIVLIRAFAACVVVAAIVWGSAAGAAFPSAWHGVPVFMYHRVDQVIPADRFGNDLTVTPAQFETQLRYLRDVGVRTITAGELVAALAADERPLRAVVLTFDDGYEDNATYAFPLLRRYGMTATFFIVTSNVGRPGHLTWREIRAMRDAGMEIAAHGATHADLSELTMTRQLAQATQCLERLRRYAGVSPRVYAYPAGRFDRATLLVMRKVGMLGAFTTRPGLVASLDAPYVLPRYRVHRRGAQTLFARFFARERLAGAGRRPSLADVDAAARAAGNRRPEAIALARVLLATEWPAQVLKIRIDAVGTHEVAGLVLSGVKFHRPLDQNAFAQEAAQLVELTFAHSPVEEVDVTATVPAQAPVGAPVSGDLALPTAKTVFSATVRRAGRPADLAAAFVRSMDSFWDRAWLARLQAVKAASREAENH